MIRPDLLMGFFQDLLDVVGEDFNGFEVLSTLRNDDVGEVFGGFNELHMAGADGFLVTIEDGFDVTAPFHDIAADDPGEPHVGGTVDEDLDIHEPAQTFVSQAKDPFNDEHMPGFNPDGFGLAGAGDEGIGGLFNGMTGLEGLDVFHHQREFDRFGVVEILFSPFLQGKMAVVVIVGIL